MAKDYELPEEFQEAADRFVALANELGNEHNNDWVRAVMMYATARYNGFAWLTRSEAPEQTLEEAAGYYAGEYRTMFRENIKELEPVYRGAVRGPGTTTQ